MGRSGRGIRKRGRRAAGRKRRAIDAGPARADRGRVDLTTQRAIESIKTNGPDAETDDQTD